MGFGQMGGKSSGNSIGIVVLLAGIGLAGANGLTIEEGVGKINSYIDQGLQKVAGGNVPGSLGPKMLDDLGLAGSNSNPVHPPAGFMGINPEITPDDTSEEDIISAVYPDLCNGRSGK